MLRKHASKSFVGSERLRVGENGGTGFSVWRQPEMVLELLLGKCISQSASLCFKFIKLFKKEYIFHLKIVDQGLKTKYV